MLFFEIRGKGILISVSHPMDVLVVLVSHWYCVAFWNIVVVQANGVYGCGLLSLLIMIPLTMDSVPTSGLWICLPIQHHCVSSVGHLGIFGSCLHFILRLWNPRVFPQTHIPSIYVSEELCFVACLMCLGLLLETCSLPPGWTGESCHCPTSAEDLPQKLLPSLFMVLF